MLPRHLPAVSDKLLAQEDLVALDRGCICCSLRKDILRALAEIERRARQRGRRFDSIILETTGLADPAPVAFTFLANPWIASRFKLDSILCVVDARYLMQVRGTRSALGRVLLCILLCLCMLVGCCIFVLLLPRPCRCSECQFHCSPCAGSRLYNTHPSPTTCWH